MQQDTHTHIIYTFVCVCVCVCIYTHTHTHTHIYIYILYIIYIYIYIFMYVRIYERIYTEKEASAVEGKTGKKRATRRREGDWWKRIAGAGGDEGVTKRRKIEIERSGKGDGKRAARRIDRDTRVCAIR